MLILRLHLDPVPARGFSASPDTLARKRISYCYWQTLSTIVGIEQRHYDSPPPFAYLSLSLSLPGRRFVPLPRLFAYPPLSRYLSRSLRHDR